MDFQKTKLISRTLAIGTLIAIPLSALADPCIGRDCVPTTQQVTFDLSCDYADASNPTGYKNCVVTSSFPKLVTADGGEFADTSSTGTDPTLVVTCDGSTIYNDSATRSTGLLETIIVAESGPTPELVLGRGELHDGTHVANSSLTVDTGSGTLTTSGTCTITATP